ncbi:MAG: tetratricopeptide repeat protein [Fimbriimonadaceae bacterium]|nr:tetratricopeptide repeat protein [Chitinophagales bacterium]
MLSKYFILMLLCSYIFSCNNRNPEVVFKLPPAKKNSLEIIIDSLNQKSWDFRNSNRDSLKFYALLAIEKSEKINYVFGLADGYSRLGHYEREKENYNNSLNNYRRSLEYRLLLDSAILIARTYSSIGNVFMDSEIYDSSVYYHNKAIAIADSVKNYKEKANFLNNMGTTQDNFLFYEKALGSYSQALKLREESGDDRESILQSYINIGSAYYNLGEYDSALLFLRKVITESKILKPRSVAKAYNNAGLNYQDLDIPDSAEYCFRQAIENYRLADDKDGISKGLSNLGILCMEEKKEDECIKYLLESTELAKEDSSFSLLATNYPYIGDYYKNKNQNNIAVKYYSEAIRCDSIVHMQTDKQLRSYTDIQTNFEKEKARLETEKARQEFLLKEQKQIAETQKEKLILKIIIGSAIASIVILFLLFNRRQLRKKIEYQKKLAQDRTRISSDLHDDIGAALSSISMYSDVVKMQVENKQFDDANHLLTDIASTSRELMDNMSDLVWAINPRNDSYEKIIQRTKSFAHRILQTKNIQLQFSASDNLQNINMPMEVRHNLFMIYKEAINNAAKYSEAKNVTMDIQRTDKKIISKITDDGKGFEMKGDKEGNGLKNMKRRAEEIYSAFSMESTPGKGTQIEVIYSLNT